ncbi:hypothetical protein [Chryseobacterium sp.]|uniref:hypothetical protein n=1 Tax=Chryseobacterium sp. TaxID=1871047 RepID=UPI0012A89851|nr:hypothetical protein [Chryseobacterium sp.]QFG52357.1 hypothetical protein F7R58_01845 [Chryseobacterium sp.]
MKKLITIICLLPTIFAVAQTDLNFSGNKVLEDMWFKTVFNQNIADVEGTPYYEKNFQPAKLTGTNETLSARYNVYHDNLEFIKDEKIMVVPKEEVYRSFHFMLTDEKIDLINDSYYFHIFQGKNYQAYRKPKIKFQKYKKATSGYVDDTPAKFLKLPDTYYTLISDKLVELPSNPKAFASLFPARKDEIQKFIKTNNIKLTTDADIKRVMRFIDN